MEISSPEIIDFAGYWGESVICIDNIHKYASACYTESMEIFHKSYQITPGSTPIITLPTVHYLFNPHLAQCIYTSSLIYNSCGSTFSMCISAYCFLFATSGLTFASSLPFIFDSSLLVGSFDPSLISIDSIVLAPDWRNRKAFTLSRQVWILTLPQPSMAVSQGSKTSHVLWMGRRDSLSPLSIIANSECLSAHVCWRGSLVFSSKCVTLPVETMSTSLKIFTCLGGSTC